MEIRKEGTRKDFFDNILGCLAVMGGDKDDIINLLKATRKQDNNFLNSPIWSVLGIILIGIACFDMKINNGAENSSLC